MAERYRKRPVVIEAVCWSGWNIEEVRTFITDEGGYRLFDGELFIDTLEGEHHASRGDWIVRGVQGELYPVKPDIFDATYEKVDDDGSHVSVAAHTPDRTWRA